jgi:hypothetical protein
VGLELFRQLAPKYESGHKILLDRKHEDCEEKLAVNVHQQIHAILNLILICGERVRFGWLIESDGAVVAC